MTFKDLQRLVKSENHSDNQPLSKLKDKPFWSIRNNNIAIASHSGSSINTEKNLVDGNALAGVTFVKTTDSTLISNNIQGSQNGIFLDAQSTRNTVQLNNAHDNVVDVNNANGLAPTINQNTFSDNNCQVSNPI